MLLHMGSGWVIPRVRAGDLALAILFLGQTAIFLFAKHTVISLVVPTGADALSSDAILAELIVWRLRYDACLAVLLWLIP